MRLAPLILAVLLTPTASASDDTEAAPQVVIFNNGKSLSVSMIVEQKGQVRFETARGEAFVVDRSLLRVEQMEEVNAALQALTGACAQPGAAIPTLSPQAAVVLNRVGPELLGRCWPTGHPDGNTSVSNVGGPPRTPAPAHRVVRTGAGLSPTPLVTPVPVTTTVAEPVTPTPEARVTARLISPEGEDVVLSDAPDAWNGAHVLVRVPAGTAAVVLEEADLPVDEWSLVRFRVRIVEGEHAGAEGWVFYQDVEREP